MTLLSTHNRRCIHAALNTLFTVLLFASVIANAQSVEEPVKKDWQEQQRDAITAFYRLDQSNNYTESLNYADMNVLPMGIRRTIGGMEITIAVSDIRWETTHSELTLYAKVKIPEHPKPLFFGAQGIKFSQSGDIIGDASLVLLGDFDLPISGNTSTLRLKGSLDMKSGRAKELTYVSVDCQGFREMGITGEIELSENLVSPADSIGAPVKQSTTSVTQTNKTGEKPKRVSGSFKTVVSNWNDILVGISLPPFKINGLSGFVFVVKDAIFDFSDIRNDATTQFPQGYEMNYLIPGNPTLWRGVFVRELDVILPPQFARRQNRERVSFHGKNMLFDNNGVSGLFSAQGILPIEEGTASGWRFSVDKFSMALEANRLTEAGFAGLIGLPVSEDHNLGYTGLITADDEYYLKIETLDSLSFTVFNAQAELLPNSYVEMKVIDGKFMPEAMLHGSLGVWVAEPVLATTDSVQKKPYAVFKGIEFRSLRLKTDAPKFTAEYFGYTGEMKFMNFPASITNIGLRSTEQEVGLTIGLKMTLNENLFAGTTSFELVGRLEEKKSPTGEMAEQQWKYSKLLLNNISINASVAETFTIKGGLNILRDDPVYGDGFAGEVQLTFSKVVKGLDIKTRAMFGCKDFRYWFVDASVKLPGKGVIMGPMSLTGFAGGASNRMKPTAAQSLALQTGPVYKPDEKSGLGIKAGVLFNVGSDEAMNGEALFEIAFNKNGGLSFAGFYGYAQFIGKIPGAENVQNFVQTKFTELSKMESEFLEKHPETKNTLTDLKQYEPSKAAAASFKPTVTPGQDGFSAALGIQYDFNQESLHATFDLYVNAVSGLVRGTATGNRAGWAVLHVDPVEWYLHLGTPTDRLGLKMGIGNIVNVETGSYLMAGSRIPGSPPPPKQVADILDVDLDQLDYMRDFNALGDGRGFAFGSSLKVATGDLTFLILYANFQAGVGFDIMLKDYQDMQCEGRSGPLGFDGWYANGQAYAYLQGELGVKVNLWFIKAKIPIIKGAAAALLQAQLPNPAYFKGYMGVRFSVLGGLVSGNCRFKVTIGEKCELVIPGGSPLDFRMISDMTPEDKSDEVDVFAAPQAAFTMNVNKAFRVEDDQGIKTYRISLTEFVVLDSGKSLPGKLVWTQEKDRASFYSDEVFPSHRKLTARVKVGFEEFKNEAWRTVYTSGKKAEEIMEVTFETGDAPEIIPVQNIQYAYPVLNQKFYLQGESNKASIQLKRGQSYLFSDLYSYEIQLTGNDGSTQHVPFNYTESEKQIYYTLPELSNQQFYQIDFVAVPVATAAGQEATAEQKQTMGEGDDLITVTTQQASDVTRTDVGKNLLQYSFGTSQFNTFNQKLNAVQKGRAMVGKVSSDVINLQYELTGGEPFELNDLIGTEFNDQKSLVQVEAILTDAYYTDDIHPLIYKGYPMEGIRLTRDVSVLGVPPVRALPVSTAYLTELDAGNFQGIVSQRFPYIYDLPNSYKRDFVELQNKIVNRFMGTAEQQTYAYIINGYYKSIRFGYYKVRLQYVMPDSTKGTSAEFDFYNFIK